MNYLLNLFIIFGLCWRFSFSLKKEANKIGITCGQPKINKLVETVIRSRRPLRTDKTIRFMWTLFITKKEPRQINYNYEQYEDYYEYDNFQENILCKGFLIHPQVVLTTARCIEEFLFTKQKNSGVLKGNDESGQQDPKSVEQILLENIEIRNGGWIPVVVHPLIYTTPPLIYEQFRNVRNMSIHPNYNCSSIKNNHALLLLSTSFDMSKPDIDVLCLSKTETVSLQCETVQNMYSSDLSYKSCGDDHSIHYQEKFYVCPKDLDYSKDYYYYGLQRHFVISSSQEKEIGTHYDHFIGNLDWVQSFLYENGVNDTLYEI